MEPSKLFQPFKVGHVHLDHRVVMAPMTRFRADQNHVPLLPQVKEYYSQRSATPGTLLIAEATAVSLKHVGYAHYAGIWNEDQVRNWREVTDAVHARRCHIFLQLCCPGRTADSGFPNLAPSPIPLDRASSAITINEGAAVPSEMTATDIRECIDSWVAAARNAIAAGFDGVEIHGANGYLVDQFLQESCNHRTDEWGGSIQNRSKFALDLTKAIASAIGADRVGFRISPWSTYLCVEPNNPVPQFTHLVAALKEFDLAYLHVVESCVDNWYDVDRNKSITFVLDIWDSLPAIVTGGYDAISAREAVDSKYSHYNVAVGFGRSFLSTPDWVFRVRKMLPPNELNLSTFYTPEVPQGYTDYPVCKNV